MRKIKLNKTFIKKIAHKYGIDISGYRMDQLIKGYKGELEHDTPHKPAVDMIKTLGDPLKIVVANLDELPDYYDEIEKVKARHEVKEMVRKMIKGRYV